MSLQDLQKEYRELVNCDCEDCKDIEAKIIPFFEKAFHAGIEAAGQEIDDYFDAVIDRRDDEGKKTAGTRHMRGEVASLIAALLSPKETYVKPGTIFGMEVREDSSMEPGTFRLENNPQNHG